jgi:hypothetical protein
VGNFKWGFTAAIFAMVVSVLLGLVSGVGGVHVFLRALVFAVVFFGLGFGLHFVINSYFPELLYMNEETASSDSGTEENAGHISIAMDSMGEYAVPELFEQKGETYELGNIEDLISGAFRPGGRDSSSYAESNQPAYPSVNFSMMDEGIDQNKETGYNDLEEFGDISFGEPGSVKSGGFDETSSFEAEKPPAFQPQFASSIGDDDSGLGGLPDLDMMAMAFSNFSGPLDSASSSTPSIGPTAPVDEAEPDRSQYKGNKPQALQGDFQPQAIAQGIRTVLSKD